MRTPVRIGVVAGEVSGDLLAAGLMRELKRRLPHVVFEGIGGPRMQAEGCASLYPMERLSLIGFEALGRYPELAAQRRRLAAYFQRRPPALFIGVDAPDYNLGLEQKLRSHGIPTMHYVSPTVWAWRGWRLRTIHHAVDHMLTLFPFEAKYYRDRKIPVTFVGHPLADAIEPATNAAALRRRLRLPARFKLVALLPGSRTHELDRHADLFVRTAQWLSARHPDIRFVVPFASPGTRALFEQALRRQRADEQIFRLLDDHALDAMAAADVVLLASGTATLEAALLGKPMVVTYRVSWISYYLIRLLAHVRLYSLPNHLAGRMLVPELMQRDAVPEKLGRAVERYLTRPAEAAAVTRVLGRIRRTLRRNTHARAAQAVIRFLRTRGVRPGTRHGRT
ncbi:MAG: lipid-A-disaccharide synthase [Gammaproteobacteria bacterium]|nr:lipid-A-disaccharide synthase [Gammaproteobacteria bacterium]